MQVPEIDAILSATLDDHRLSRGERRALGEVLDEACTSASDRALWRSRAFALATEAARSASDVLPWLEEVIKALVHEPTAEPRAEAWFSPGPDPIARLQSLIERAAHSIEVCVFALTDDRLTTPLLQAHRRGLRVRVLTDDDKAFDLGADAARLESAGIPLRTDRSPHHMHHKFAIFDATTLATGSYNWTRSASDSNQETLIILEDRRLVTRFQEEFERLWLSFA
ncbi:MAG: DUF1669 domain-containing protein [Deltaproteobacteria bacterium]|nr:DUF1669 domain-containing protein [Deltaproteobacteria bacterium]